LFLALYRQTQTRVKFNKTQNSTKVYTTHVSNLDFRFLHCLNHESVILGQVENTSAFPGRGKFSESIIPTYSQHIISRINLKQLPQMSEESKQNKVNIKAQHNFNTLNSSNPNIIQNTRTNFNTGHLTKTSTIKQTNKQTCIQIPQQKELYLKTTGQ